MPMMMRREKYKQGCIGSAGGKPIKELSVQWPHWVMRPHEEKMKGVDDDDRDNNEDKYEAILSDRNYFCLMAQKWFLRTAIITRENIILKISSFH